jgi:hypothetical protein
MISILIAVLALAGCGGSDAPTRGRTEIIFPGVAGIGFEGPLAIDTSGSNATVSGICPFGSGTVTMVGNGSSASWSGEFVCPPITIRDCAIVALTLTSLGRVTTNSDKTQTATGSGRGTACGTDSAVTFTFENF